MLFRKIYTYKCILFLNVRKLWHLAHLIGSRPFDTILRRVTKNVSFNKCLKNEFPPSSHFAISKLI